MTPLLPHFLLDIAVGLQPKNSIHLMLQHFYLSPSYSSSILIFLPPHKHPGRYPNTGYENIFQTQRDIPSLDQKLVSDRMHVESFLFDRVNLKVKVFQFVKSL